MEYLSPLDASFLDAEDEDPHASLAIASVAVLDGPPPGQADFAAAIRGRLPLVPRYLDAGQCSGLQAGGEGPRWEGRQARAVP